jgi:hypothetical protein
MAIQNEPTRITIPFADSGTKNSIPDTQPSPSASQAASWTDGFPAQCSLPLSAGGIPPARADFNGIFNAITQSERFTQEGGVWLWSNAVDYAASRMVLGSDGKLYWGAAQSGPNVGGAVDPTTDNGTYWVRLPSMADIAAQNYATQGWIASQNFATQGWVSGLGYATQTWVGSQGYATQTWVNAQGYAKSAGVIATLLAPVYIDPNGSDSSDGRSETTPVRTFARALEVASTVARNEVSLFVAAGTYEDSPTFSNMRCILSLKGPVTLPSLFRVVDGSIVYVNPSIGVTNASLTINNGLSVETVASFVCSVHLTVTTATGIGINCVGRSYIRLLGNCTVTAPNSTTAIYVTESSYFSFAYNLTVSVDVSGSAIYINHGSVFLGYSSSSVVINSRTAPVVYGILGMYGAIIILQDATIDRSVKNYPISAAIHSYIEINGSLNITCGESTTAEGVSAMIGSIIYFSSTAAVSIIGMQGADNFICVSSGFMSLVDFNGTQSVYLYLYTGRSAILANMSGNVSISNTNMTISGSSTRAFVTSQINSLVDIANGVNISTIGATGKRYISDKNSIIETGGGGPNKIPGTIEGTVSNDAAYY